MDRDHHVRYEVLGGGVENPFTIHKIYTALTPSDSGRDWASESAAANQAENYVKMRVPVHPMSLF